jgi:hypothetical protein
MIVETFRKAGVVEDEEGGRAARIQFEVDDGVDAGIPGGWAPGLHNALSRYDFDVTTFDESAKGFECAAGVGVNFGWQCCESCESFRIKQSIENMLRCGWEIDFLVN